jgi:hypothetical protein
MKTKVKALKQSPSIIRIAKLKSKSGREIYERVTADGKLSKRAAVKLGITKVATWVEVEAKTWAAATAQVRAGKGTSRKAGAK